MQTIGFTPYPFVIPNRRGLAVRNPYGPLECRSVRPSCRVFFVYILSSLSGTLYVGISNDVQRRSAEHWIGSKKSFTARYSVDRLVYFETFSDVVKAIAREKQIKGWRREKKIVVIQEHKPVLERFAARTDARNPAVIFSRMKSGLPRMPQQHAA